MRRLYRHDPSKPSLEESVVLLLNTPRSLKAALRLCHETWQHLKGEIDFDDVLIMSALRASRPEVFSLVNDEIDAFRHGFGSLREEHGERKAKEHPTLVRLDKLLGDDTDVVMRNAVRSVLEHVFPGYADDIRRESRDRNYVNNPQGLAIVRHVDYWDRYTSMPKIEDADSDQAALIAIDAWKDGKKSDLLKRLLADDSSTQIATFVGQFSRTQLCRLLGETCDHLMPRSAGDWYEHARAPAVPEIFHMMVDLRPNENELAKVVSSAIRKAIPVNLPLVCQLASLYCSSNRGQLTSLLPDGQKDQIRQETVVALVEVFPLGTGAEMLAAINDGSPFLLRWLCSSLDKRGDDNEGLQRIPFEEWPDFARVMIEAAEIDPAIMLPQIASFVRTHGSRYQESSDDEPGIPSSDYVHGFDEGAEQRLFPDQHETLKALFAKTESPDWLSPESAMIYEAVRSAYVADDT